MGMVVLLSAVGTATLVNTTPITEVVTPYVESTTPVDTAPANDWGAGGESN